MSQLTSERSYDGWTRRIMSVRWWVWIWLLLVCDRCVATEPYRVATSSPFTEPWRISRYPELLGRGLRAITEDSEGRIWFGLRDGVVRYDGLRWTDYAIPQTDVDATAKHNGNSVETLLCCSDGTLMAGGVGGLYRFDGQRWDRVFPHQATATLTITAITESDEGSIWGACSFGPIRWRPDATTLFTSPDFDHDSLRGFGFDDIRTLPASCLPERQWPRGTGMILAGGRVVAISETSPAAAAGVAVGDQVIGSQPPLNESTIEYDVAPDTTVQLIVKSPVGNRLEDASTQTDAESDSSAVIEFDSSVIEGNYRTPWIHTLYQGQDGRTWFGARQGRVFFTPDDGETWDAWAVQDQIKIGRRPGILQTSDGQIWIASEDRNILVSRYDGSQWSSERLTVVPGPNFVGSMAETIDGTVCVCGSAKLFGYRHDNWRSKDTRDLNVPGDAYRMLIASDQSLWIIGFGQDAARVSFSPSEFVGVVGLDYQCVESDGTRWLIEPATGRAVQWNDREAISYGTEDGLMDRPTGIAASAQGDVVAVGAHQGIASVAFFDDGQWHRQSFPKVSAEFNGAGLTFLKSGEIAVASKPGWGPDQQGGIVIGRGDHWVHHAPPIAPGAAAAIVQSPDGKVLCFGSYGIRCFDGQTWSRPDDPMAQEIWCPDACIDVEGTVWVATRTNGILRLRGGQWTEWSTDAGLRSRDTISLAVSTRGDVWACTTEGIDRFDGKRFWPLDLSGQLGRKSLRPGSNGSMWLDGKLRIGYDDQPPIVKLDQDAIEIDHDGSAVASWHGVDAWNRTPVEKLKWAYRIDDRPWSDFSGQRHVELQGLSIGDHQLRVIACDSHFNVSPTSPPLAVTVLPPVWIQPWFVTLATTVAGLVMALAVGLIRRGVALRATNRQLESARSLLAEKFAQTSAQFQAVCDCSPVGIFVTDVAGNVTYMNHQLESIAGLERGGGMGIAWGDAIHPEDRERMIRSWTFASRERRAFRASARFLHPDGKVVYFQVAANRIEDQGRLIGFVGIVEDVSEQLEANRILQQRNEQLSDALQQLEVAQENAIRRERLSALGQMAAGVAHDINNSLAPLLTYAELLSEDPNIHDLARQRVDLIRMGVNDTAGIVKRLEHFYKQSHHRDALKMIGLGEIVAQTIELTRPKWNEHAWEKGHSINVVFHNEDDPRIWGHPSQIRSVLTNLIFNSIDAIQGDGTIEVRVNATEEHAEVRVQDNGCGMTSDQLDRCLEPFYTSKPKGSGLGLSECHGVVRQHHGKLEIQSEIGRGTTVVLRFPRIKSEPDSPKVSVPGVSGNRHSDTEPSRPLGANFAGKNVSSTERESIDPHACAEANIEGRTVLYIDDDESVRKSTQALLTAIGMNVQSAVDGSDGLSRLEQDGFDLVICDQGLPGMDGIELLNIIRRRWPQMPVIIVSGWPLRENQLGNAPDGFLEKPVRFDDLVALLKNTLSPRQTA